MCDSRIGWDEYTGHLIHFWYSNLDSVLSPVVKELIGMSTGVTRYTFVAEVAVYSQSRSDRIDWDAYMGYSVHFLFPKLESVLSPVVVE